MDQATSGGLARRALTAAAWAGAAAGTWLAFSWTALLWVPAALFAAALGLDAWRRGRRLPSRPGLPRPMDAHAGAAWAAAALAAAQVSGYSPDWFVLALLAAAATLKAAGVLGGAAGGSGGAPRDG